MLKGMEGSTLGVWVAHGEGHAHFPSAAVRESMLKGQLAPIRYVNDAGEVTQSYPFNPNGSPEGVAGLCSAGQHFVLILLVCLALVYAFAVVWFGQVYIYFEVVCNVSMNNDSQMADICASCHILSESSSSGSGPGCPRSGNRNQSKEG